MNPEAQMAQWRKMYGDGGDAIGCGTGGECRVLAGVNVNEDLVIQRSLSLLEKEGDTSSPVGRIGEMARPWVSAGSAAERFVSSEQAAALKAAADGWSKDLVQSRVGGNAALMSVALAQHGVPVTLAGPVGPNVRALLPDTVVPHSTQPHDEVHFILEYATGEQLGDTTAPRANRFIVHADTANARLHGVEDLLAQVTGPSPPSLLILAGLHLLEGVTDPATQTGRLDAVRTLLDAAAERSVRVHLELASTAELPFLQSLAETVLPRVDSIGLNEEELGALYRAVGGAEHGVAAFTKPQLATTVAAIGHILRATPRLSRVHMHFLAYHVIAIRPQSSNLWPRTPEALIAGAAASALRACNGTDIVSLFNEYLAVPVPDVDEETFHSPVLPYMWGTASDPDVTYHVVPTIVCTRPTATVGLGDLISGTALAYQTALTP